MLFPIHTHTKEGQEIPGGGGLKSQTFETKCEDNLEFPGGRGVQNKKPSMGGVWIFSGAAQLGCHNIECVVWVPNQN